MAALLVACFAPAAFAQTGDDYNKVEFFGGYSHNRVDTGIDDNDPDLGDIFDEREGFNGFNASITGNVSRYVGLKFDYSYHQRDIEFGADNTNFRLHNFLGGVQFKDNTKDSEKVVKPFAHILAGAARASVDLTEFDDTLEDVSETGFAAAIGGGLDIRVHPRVDIRAIQFDYNPNRFEGQTSHNFRIGVGIVIH
jgi:hypothetical protein